MKHTQDELIIAQEIRTATSIFRMEEYWEEDDSGYCCVDYILAKHTRVTASDPVTGQLQRTFDLDGLEYEKSMTLNGDILTVTYQPEFGQVHTAHIRVSDLSLIQE